MYSLDVVIKKGCSRLKGFNIFIISFSAEEDTSYECIAQM